MTTQIRLSPSGPNINNASGGPLSPGTGARLRLSEAQATVGGTSGLIPTAPAVLGSVVGSSQIQCSIPLPDPDLNYRATVLCEVENPSTNVPGEVQLYLETSTDGGTVWVEQASNTHRVNSTEVAPAVALARQCRLDLMLKAGSLLGVTSAPATTVLLVRAKIGASSGGGILNVVSAVTPGGDLKSVGSMYLSLEECF